MSDLKRTPFHRRHVDLGAKMVDFAGWEMPLTYPGGVVAEHLATRRTAGLFDVSHMGRFVFGEPGSLHLLQRMLSNNVAALEVGQAQYTFLPTTTGGALDDAYLYRFLPDEYLLVVNAANRERDLAHLKSHGLSPADETGRLAMLSVQGPLSPEIVGGLLTAGALPEPRRNALSVADLGPARVLLARTGYTGEALGFELFFPAEHALTIWDLFVQRGAVPCGLGARDTLRLEAALPLYGNELGTDPEGNEIPLFSSRLAQFAISFSPLKGDYIGREALLRQQAAYRRILAGDRSNTAALPRIIRSVALTGRGVARKGAPVRRLDERPAGWVTSGTMVPYWQTAGEELAARPGHEYALRSICLALLDIDLRDDDQLFIDIRGRLTPAVVVPYHLRTDASPYSRPIVYHAPQPEPSPAPVDAREEATDLVRRGVANHVWRGR